jgi:hypothetical protein
VGAMQRKLDAWSPREPTAKNDPDNMTTTKTSKVNLECGARHESAHIVIAAEEGLRLKPEGLMVDRQAGGLRATTMRRRKLMQHGSEISSLHWLASRLRIGFERRARTHQETIWTCLLRFGRRDLRIDERSVPNLWECGPARFHFSVSTQLEILVYESHMRHGDTVQTGQSELAKRRQSLDDEPFAYRQPKPSSSFLSFS